MNKTLSVTQWLESDYGLSSSAGGWRGCGQEAPTAGPPTPPLSQPQLLSRAHQGLVLGYFCDILRDILEDILL